MSRILIRMLRVECVLENEILQQTQINGGSYASAFAFTRAWRS